MLNTLRNNLYIKCQSRSFDFERSSSKKKFALPVARKFFNSSKKISADIVDDFVTC